MYLVYIIVIFSLLCGKISAEPTSIYDSGNTTIEPYLYDMSLLPDDYSLLTAESIDQAVTMPDEITFDLYPIETPSMQVGKVESHVLDQPVLSVPLFFIGSDEISQQWLMDNKFTLANTELTGFLIQAEQASDLDTMQAIAGDSIVILPMSAEVLAEFLPSKYYPIVIEPDRVWQ